MYNITNMNTGKENASTAVNLNDTIPPVTSESEMFQTILNSKYFTEHNLM